MKKKLLIAVHTLQLGGVEKIVINLLKMMDKEKYDIIIYNERKKAQKKVCHCLE